MVSLSHLHHSFSRLVLHLFWSPEQSGSELCSGSPCSRLPCGSGSQNPPPALLPAALLMCSDTRDAGRGCAFCTRLDRNASYNHKLAPTNSASNVNCAPCTELARNRFVGKWQWGQRNFISEAHLYFVVSCACIEISALSKTEVFTQYERQTPFASQSKDCPACCKTARE